MIMSQVELEYLKQELIKYQIELKDDSVITTEYRVFNILHDPKDKDISSFGGADLDGDVAYVFTIDGNEYVFPSITTIMLLRYLESISGEGE